MKFLGTEFAYLLDEAETRRNLIALFRVLISLTLLIGLYAVLFHLIMHYEGQEHSWITGVYWTLTVMSTLGFGDITFHTDLGRIFSMVVLMTGIVMLMIVLPFTFIRYFYAPWLEAQIRSRAPRKIPPDVQGHVVVCRFDEITRALFQRLTMRGISCFVIEPDPTAAAELAADKIPVLTGDLDSKATYEALHVERACMVVANLDDATNCNITLTVREVTPSTPVVALVDNPHSIDILELSGASHVLDLKQQLGVHLANRVGDGLHVVGRYRELCLAEFSIYRTPFAGHTVQTSELRRRTGVNIVGIWDRARITPVRADTLLDGHVVAVVVGTQEQMDALGQLLRKSLPPTGVVIVIGGGKVGKAAAHALKARGNRVHVIDRNAAEEPALSEVVDRVFVGDAANLEVVVEAGIRSADTVVLTTNDDATNIYLAVYCRKLNPEVSIVSRITHGRNLEAIHRAGSDFVLSYSGLEVESLMAIARGRELVVLGEGVELFVVPAPDALIGKTLLEAAIGQHTGLRVVAVHEGNKPLSVASPDTVISELSELVVIGTGEQGAAFAKRFA